MPVDGDIILKAGLDTAGVTKSISNLSKSISKGLKNTIRLAFGVRSVFALIRKLRTSVMSGAGDLAQVYEPFNEAVSEIMTSLRLLRNTFVSAFAPIVETVAPILSTFINSMAKAVSMVGQFIAALTGKQYVQAAAVQMDYASSVNKSAKSSNDATAATKKQTKAQKELNREITHFDDLVILHDKHEDDTDTDTDVDTTPVAFSPGSVGDAVSQFAKDFLAAWENADFTDIGRKVGEKLKAALESIPWDKIKSTLSKIAKSIATFLNGYFSTPGLYYTIGKTIAEGINSAFTFLYTFITTFDWEIYGNAVKDKLLGVFENIDWTLIYDTLSELGTGIGTTLQVAFNNPEIWNGIFTTIANGLNAVIYGIDNFVRAIDWGTLASNIATGLNDGIEAIDWDALAQTLIDLINGAFDAWYNFVTTFNFKKFATHIAVALSSTIKGINWKEGGASVAQTINGLLSALAEFVKNTDWKSLGSSIIDAIKGFFEEFDWATVSETLSALLTALYDALTGIIEEIDWTTLPHDILSAIKDFFTGFDWTETAESVGEYLGTAFKALVEVGTSLPATLAYVGSEIILGLGNGIINALVGIGEWIKTNIVDPFIKGFKDAFGIHSPADTIIPLGRQVILGLFQGISDVLLGMGKWIKDNIVDPFIDNIKSFFGLDDGEASPIFKIGQNLIGSLKAGVGNIMTNINNWIQTNITGKIIKGIQSLFGLDNTQASEIFSIGKNLITGLKDGILGDIQNVGNWLQTNVTDPLLTKFKNLLGINSPSKVFDEYGGYLMEGLKEGIVDTNKESNSKSPKKAVESVYKSMQEIFSTQAQLTKWVQLGSKLMVFGLKAGIAKQSSTVVNTVQMLEDTMRKTISNKLESWKSLGSNLVTSLQSGVTSQQINLINTFVTIIDSVTNRINSLATTFEESGRQWIASLRVGIYNASSDLETTMSSLAQRVSTSFSNGGNWYSLGSNIGLGIYNGLIAYSSTLEVLAWNTAVRMYNSAVRALDIHSPSKKFAYIGEMVAKGLGEGVEANQDIATDAVANMASDMVDVAKETDPSITISTSIDDWINSLDFVLTKFSETIINRFDTMMSTLARLTDASILLPAVAQGRVIPSSMNTSGNNSDTTASMMRMLENLTSNQITLDELRPLLIEMFQDYMNLGWYVGDEQLARHVNNGNLLLDRRYSIIKT